MFRVITKWSARVGLAVSLLGVFAGVVRAGFVPPGEWRPFDSTPRTAKEREVTPAHPALAKSNRLRVAFFSGIRYIDGFGDLTLNKYLIDDQIERLRKQYGNQIEIHVVFLEEVQGFKYKSTFRGFEVVQKLYTEPRYANALERFLRNQSNGAFPQSKPHYDSREGLHFWTEQGFRHFVEHNPNSIDLGIMASEVSASLPDDPGFFLPLWIEDGMNVVAFREYSLGNRMDYQVNDESKPLTDRVVGGGFEVIYNPNSKSVHLTAKMDTGPGAAGMIFGPRYPVPTKEDLMALIRRDLENGEDRFSVRKFYYGPTEASPETILQSDPWLVVNRTSQYDRTHPEYAVASVPLLVAFFHAEADKSDVKKNYVVFSNEVEMNDMGLESALNVTLRHDKARAKRKMEGASYGLHYIDFDSDERLTDAEFQEARARFEKFVKERVLFLKPGRKSLSTSEMRGFFAAENGAIHVQSGGFGTLADAMAVETFPAMVLRSYHRAFGDRFRKRVLNWVKDKYPKYEDRIHRYMYLANGLIASDDFAFYVKESQELRPILAELTRDLVQQENISTYISDVVAAFYEAKKEGATGLATTSLGRAVVAKGAAEADVFVKTDEWKTKNLFLRSVGWKSEVLLPKTLVPCVIEKVAEGK